MILTLTMGLLFAVDPLLANESTQNAQVVHHYHNQVEQPFLVELGQMIVVIIVFGVLFGGG